MQDAQVTKSLQSCFTTASDEDPKPKLIVRVGFCTAKSDIPQYYM